MSDWSIDYSTLKDFGVAIEETKLKSLEANAHRQVDLLTNYFYEDKQNFDEDMASENVYIKRRAKSYREAIISTILLMNETDSTSTASLNTQEVTSIKIGDTTVNGGDLSKATSGGLDGYLVPAESVNLLSRNGLLHSGLG